MKLARVLPFTWLTIATESLPGCNSRIMTRPLRIQSATSGLCGYGGYVMSRGHGYVGTYRLVAWLHAPLFSPLQKRESNGASFLYWLDWKSKRLRVSADNCPNGSRAKAAKFHINPCNFVAFLPNRTNSLFWVTFEDLLFCHFPPPNTSIRGWDSQI